MTRARWRIGSDSPEHPSFLSPSPSTRTLRDMVRDLSNASFRDNRVARPPPSESYSSTYANPPTPPDQSSNGSPAPPSDHATGQLTSDISNLSLSVNYLPSKFSGGGGEVTRRRRRDRDRDSNGDFLGPGVVPKMGGGVDAFRNGEARMGGEGDGDDEDEDDEGDDGEVKKRWFVRGRREPPGVNKKLRWNKFKWTLFVSNVILTFYSFIALVFCLLTWFNIWTRADIIRVGNHTELVISTLAASIGIFTALIGWAGILMNNRSFLAVYSFLLWITFLFLVMPGYITYKRRTFNLEGKINHQWSRELGPEGRLRVQNQLLCCGYFNPYVEATISQTCYARTILPGCKGAYLRFERVALKRWYTASFGLVPFHLLIMTAGLLCSNHVTYRFGKGMMPKAYRLSMTSMAVIMDNYASQMAEQYSGAATGVETKSRSNLDTMPSMPYADLSSTTKSPMGRMHMKYDSLNTQPPNEI